MSRFAERLFPWLAALIAIAFVSFGIDELFYQTGPRPHRLETVLWVLAISVLFGFAAASCWLQMRIRRLAALVCGGCLALFTLSALREGGWDEASDTIWLGLVVFSGLTAVIGIVVGARGFVAMTPPNKSLERTREG